MSHNILLKRGWEVVFNAKSFTVYNLDITTLIVWDSGKYEVFNV